MSETSALDTIPDARGEAFAAPPLRGFLRAETAADHDRLDARFAGMFDGGDAATYHRFIRMNHACHAALEPGLAERAAAVGLDANRAGRGLLPALEADMRAMRLAALDLRAPMPAGAAEVAGLTYVLDGSRLGARYLYRDIRSRGLSQVWATQSYAYLRAASERDPFRERMAALSEALPHPGDRERARKAARLAFALFEAALDMIEGAERPEAIAS